MEVDFMDQSMALTPGNYLNALLAHFSLHGFHSSVVIVGKSIILQIEQEFIIDLKRIKNEQSLHPVLLFKWLCYIYETSS